MTALSLLPATSATILPVSTEAFVRGGAYANADMDEAATNYLHVKYSASLDTSRKSYFQFDLTGWEPDTNAPAVFTVAFLSSYQQNVQLWALNQAFPAFTANLTWNNAPANDTNSNALRLSGTPSATAVSTPAVIPVSGTTPYAFTLPRLGDFVSAGRITLVLCGVTAGTGSNNASGLRIKRAACTLTFDRLGNRTPPSFSSLGNQTIPANASSAPLAFTLQDTQDAATNLHPFATSSDTNVIPVGNVQLGGSGTNRTVTVRATNQTGVSTLTLRAVNSAGQTGSTAFTVSVIASNPPPTTATNYDVYLVAGQSNMDGRGQTSELTGTNAHWAATQTDVRIFYANPINLDSTNPSYRTGWQTLAPGFSVPPGFTGALPSPRFGPELSFARAVADSHPGRPLAIIKVTQGGTNLRYNWNPADGYLYATFTNMARAALQALRDEGHSWTLRGLIWHQGESDVGSGANLYYTNLTAFIGAVRRDFGVTNLPFVVGEIATNKDAAFRAVQCQVAQALPWVGFASADGLETVEGTHFTTESVLRLGQRFAAGLEIPPVEVVGVSRTNTNLVLTASGLAGTPCRLLATTNVGSPVVEWKPVSTNTFDAAGQSRFTNRLAPAKPQEFLRVLGN